MGEIYLKILDVPIEKRIAKTQYGSSVMEFIYGLDAKLEKIKEYDSSVLTKGGGYNNEIIFKYNNGLLTQVINRDAISMEISEEITIEYVDKSTIKIIEKQAKGDYETAFALTLNDSGQLILRKDEESSIKYEYDEKGNVAKLIRTDIYTGETIYTYKYDDKKSYLSNTGLPIWYWIFQYSNITKNYQYCYDGPNNITELAYSGFTYGFKYDYDENDYPTVIYSLNENNEKIGYFTYDIIK